MGSSDEPSLRAPSDAARWTVTRLDELAKVIATNLSCDDFGAVIVDLGTAEAVARWLDSEGA